MNKTIPNITFQHYWKAVDQTPQNAAPHDICNKANQIALAEQSTNTGVPLITIEQIAATYPNESAETQFSVLTRCNNAIITYNKASEQPIISAEEARKLGAGKAEWLTSKGNWCMCGATDFLSHSISGEVIKYRAIKQPEPVEPTCQVQFINGFESGEVITMTREKAKKLQDELGDTVEWECEGSHHTNNRILSFCLEGIYTYKQRATVKLTIDNEPAQMLTPEQCEVERLARIDTHDVESRSNFACCRIFEKDDTANWFAFDFNGAEYRLIRKQPKLIQLDWTQPLLRGCNTNYGELRNCFVSSYGNNLHQAVVEHMIEGSDTKQRSTYYCNNLRLAEPTNANWQVYIQGETDLTTLKGVEIECMYWDFVHYMYQVGNYNPQTCAKFESQIKAYRITGLVDGYCYGGEV